MLLQISDASVDDRPGPLEVLGAGGHEATIKCVCHWRRAGDEEDRVGGDGVDL